MLAFPALTLCGVLLVAAPTTAAEPAPLGVTWSGWRGQFRNPEARLASFREVGFPLVSIVGEYAYVGLDRVDLASGPTEDELAGAIEAALRAGLQVIVKPHLNPPIYQPGFAALASDNHSWRVHAPWRGFFDVSPMAPSYRDGVVLASLRAVKAALDRTPSPAPIRVELGVELMNSIIAFPDRWVRLLADARRELRRLGLSGRVLLSHNFSHHIAIPDDQIDRMSDGGRRALARYIRGLDALSLSQYMDLTIAVPDAERGRRVPTEHEVAEALLRHEQAFRRDVLEGRLGLRASEVPPLHIGEFGIGRGGLRHPNVWSGATTPDEDRRLAAEIAVGHRGLLRYLADPRRTARSAVLWTTGRFYDVFGWGNPAYAIPEAAAALRAGLAPQK